MELNLYVLENIETGKFWSLYLSDVDSPQYAHLFKVLSYAESQRQVLAERPGTKSRSNNNYRIRHFIMMNVGIVDER
jgi:endoglucanase Acf2